jgi:hypothetical protein
MWNYRACDSNHNVYDGYKARKDVWGCLKSKDVSRESRVVRVEELSSRRLKTFFDPWQAVLASDKVLVELGNKCREIDVVIRKKQQQNEPRQSFVWLEVRKKHAVQAMAMRIEMLKEADPCGREDDTYLVVFYDADDDVADNTCTATIEEYLSFGEANSRFKAHVTSWNLVESFAVDTRGLPKGSMCLKNAEVADDARDQDVSVVLARAPRTSVGLFGEESF